MDNTQLLQLIIVFSNGTFAYNLINVILSNNLFICGKHLNDCFIPQREQA